MINILDKITLEDFFKLVENESDTFEEIIAKGPNVPKSKIEKDKFGIRYMISASKLEDNKISQLFINGNEIKGDIELNNIAKYFYSSGFPETTKSVIIDIIHKDYKVTCFIDFFTLNIAKGIAALVNELGNDNSKGKTVTKYEVITPAFDGFYKIIIDVKDSQPDMIYTGLDDSLNKGLDGVMWTMPGGEVYYTVNFKLITNHNF